MFYLEPELLQIQGVDQVLEHSKTDVDGRYSVMTTIPDFSRVTKLITANLAQSITNLNDQHSLQCNPDLPEAGVSFRSSYDDDSSDGSMQSYLSACSAIYSTTSIGEDCAPASTMVPIQAWNKPPNITPTLNTTAVSTLTPSQTAGETFNKMQEENQRLNRKVNELSSQVQALLDAQARLAPDVDPSGTVAQVTVTRPDVMPISSMDKILDALMLRLQHRVETDADIRNIPISVAPPLPPDSPGDTSMNSHDSDLTPNTK